MIRVKTQTHILANPDLNHSLTPISQRICNVQTTSKIITCKRTQFLLVEACEIMIHKLQGGTYDTIVYEYSTSHEQQLVYVTLSRAT